MPCTHKNVEARWGCWESTPIALHISTLRQGFSLHLGASSFFFSFLLAWWPGSLSDSLISTYIFTKLEWQAFMTTPRCWLQGPNLLPYDCTSGTFTHWATSLALVIYEQNSSWFFSTETVFYYIPILRFHHCHSRLNFFLYKHPIVFFKVNPNQWKVKGLTQQNWSYYRSKM